MGSGDLIQVDLPFAGATRVPFKLWWMATIDNKKYVAEVRGGNHINISTWRIEEMFANSTICIQIPNAPLRKKEEGCPHLITTVIDGEKCCIECKEVIE